MKTINKATLNELLDFIRDIPFQRLHDYSKELAFQIGERKQQIIDDFMASDRSSTIYEAIAELYESNGESKQHMRFTYGGECFKISFDFENPLPGGLFKGMEGVWYDIQHVNTAVGNDLTYSSESIIALMESVGELTALYQMYFLVKPEIDVLESESNDGGVLSDYTVTLPSSVENYAILAKRVMTKHADALTSE